MRSGLLSQFATLLGFRGVSMLMQLVTFVLLARLLSVEAFGLIGIVLALGLVVGTISDFGVSTALGRARALKEEGETSELLRLAKAAAIMVILGTGVAWLVIASLAEVPFWALILGVSLIFERYVETLLIVPIADGDSVSPGINMVGRKAGVLSAALIASFLDAASTVWLYVGGCAVTALLAWLHIRRLVPGHSVWSRVDLRSTIRRCWPFLISNLASHSRYLDTPLVGMFGSALQAGLYSAGTRLANPFALIPNTFSMILVPRGAVLDTSNVRALGGRLGLGCVGLALVFAIAYPFWVTAVQVALGDRYAQSGSVFAWTMIGLPFVSLSSMLGSLLQAQGMESLVARNGMVFALFSLLAVCVCASLWTAGSVALALAVVFALKCVALMHRMRQIRSG